MKTNHKAEVYNSPLIDEFLQEISPVELERTRKRMLLAIRIDEGIKAKDWKKKNFANAMFYKRIYRSIVLTYNLT